MNNFQGELYEALEHWDATDLVDLIKHIVDQKDINLESMLQEYRDMRF